MLASSKCVGRGGLIGGQVGRPIYAGDSLDADFQVGRPSRKLVSAGFDPGRVAENLDGRIAGDIHLHAVVDDGNVIGMVDGQAAIFLAMGVEGNGSIIGDGVVAHLAVRTLPDVDGELLPRPR